MSVMVSLESWRVKESAGIMVNVGSMMVSAVWL